MQSQDGVQVPDFAGMVRRRGVVAAAVAGAVFLASVFVAALLPNKYDASATLLIEPQTVSKNLVEAGVEESDLHNRLHLMQMQILSRGRLSRVIDDLGLYADESEEMTREDVIALMRAQIQVVPVLPEIEMDRRDVQINTFQITFRSESPRMAAAVANRLANDFIEEHIKERVQISGDTSAFIDAELERITTRAREVDQRISAIKSENAGRLPEDMLSNQRRLEHAIGSLRETQREIALARSDESFYRQQAATGSDVRQHTGQPDSPAERLQRLEMQLADFEARGYTPKHPDVIVAEAEIEILEAQIASAANDAGNLEGSSTQQVLAVSEAERARLRAESSDRDLARLRDEVVELEEALAVTPRVAEQLSLLEREREHLRSSFQSFSNKRLDAAVAADMERRQKGEQFRLLDSAVAPPNATSPNRPLILVLGLLVGLGLGGGLALLLESVDGSFHDPRGLRLRTGLPVLASVPAIVLESDRVRIKRRRLVAVALAAAISGVTLLGAGAGWWFVNGPGSSDARVEAQPESEG
jgi:succinoglycan biosynthesis transport protein ExoP